MSRARVVACLSLWLLLGSGCSIASLLDDIEREHEKSNAVVCACTTQLYELTCEGFIDDHLDPNDTCVVEALELDKEASKETLNCWLEVQKSHTECLEAEVDCLDYDTYLNSCNERLSDLQECPDLPPGVQQALNLCG